MTRLCPLFFLGLFTLWVSGCASTTPTLNSVVRPAQAARAPFVIAGRIAVKHEGKRSAATVRWAHGVGTDEILLFAPLGKTIARIKRDAQGFVLDTSDEHYAAQDAEELTQQALGWRLPLSGLQYWVLALPMPTAAIDVERDEYGRISILHQEGWSISYTRYATTAPDSLPQRLILQRDGLEIQLLIDEWEIPTQP